jgi:RNA polymerase sigma factor (sigma-70 family)
MTRPVHRAPALGPPGAPEEAAASAAPDPLLPLAERAAGGDRDALARLLSLIAPSVVTTVRVVLGAHEADLEDAAQEAMIAIADSARRFRGESSFLHYARRIAARTAFALRRARLESARKLAEAAAVPDESRPAADPAPSVEVEREQRLEAFRRLLDGLPEGQAESLAYRVLLDYPLPVIARETGVPVNTVRSRIRLARDHLRESILADPALAELLREPT